MPCPFQKRMLLCYFPLLCWLLLIGEVRSDAAAATSLSSPNEGRRVIGRKNRVTLNNKNKKTRKSNRQKNKIKQQLNQAIVQKKKDSSISTTTTAPVFVNAILIPRQLNLKSVIRTLCLVSMTFALVLCIRTSGIPHIKSVWDILYNSADNRHHDHHNSHNHKMPSDYMPSSADLHMAQIIARATRQMLPPIGLPSAGPLLGLLFSIFIYAGFTILLPRWFLPLKVFLDYKKIQPSSSTSTSWNGNIRQVLVQINDSRMRHDVATSSAGIESSSSSRRRRKGHSSIICDVMESQKRGSNDKKQSTHSKGNNQNHTAMTFNGQYTHPYSDFFELNQCRYYFDSKTGDCIDGGPTMIEGKGRATLHEIQSLVQNGITDANREVAIERYKPYNRPKLASPTILEAFLARISSPLVVLQIIGNLMSLLEDGPRSLVNTVTSLGRHYMHARQAIHATQQLNQDIQSSAIDSSNLKVFVLKTKAVGGKKKTKRSSNKRYWETTTVDELIPGDIFVLSSGSGGEGHHRQEDLEIPVDALLLDGQGLTNEAVLTGESVPQSKIPLDFEEEMNSSEESFLDMNDHRGSILFAGTNLVYSSSDEQIFEDDGTPGRAGRLQQSYNIPPHNVAGGLTCLALRTGTYSSKGQLLRTLKQSNNVGAISNEQTDKDALRLIMSLSVFAAASCLSLFVGNDEDSKNQVSAFRRVIQCTRIAIASIPSDLPLALSSVAKSCSKQLREESDVVCSEPGALLTAAYIDTVVFDKTGTITADTQALSKVVSDLESPKWNTSSDFQHFILAGCHSLVHLRMVGCKNSNNAGSTPSKIVGDPLDMSALEFSTWKFNHTSSGGYYYLPDTSKTNEGNPSNHPIRLWQIRSFPFDPNKRLSSALVLAELSDGDYKLWILTKGSPGTMSFLYKTQEENPEFVPQLNKHTQDLEAQGYRCISLGAVEVSLESPLLATLFPHGLRNVDDDSIGYARSKCTTLHRSDFEDLKPANHKNTSTLCDSVVDDAAGLDFHGFACFDAKVRTSSKRVIKELIRGGINPVMLTGDAIDAALSVASKVTLIEERKVAVLETYQGSNDTTPSLRWRFVVLGDGKGSPSSAVQTEVVDIDSVQEVIRRQKRERQAIAATGEALEIVLDEPDTKTTVFKILADNLFRFSVVARATPSLKTSVIACLKNRCDKKVLMCGDGVNDVSAMKAADVSVALLNGFGAEDENDSEQDLDDKRREDKLNLKRLGSNRRKLAASGGARTAKRKRMQNRIDHAHAEIKRKAAGRQGKIDDPGSAVLDFEDMKAMMSATMTIVKQEEQRRQALKKGGRGAARILAEERRKNSGDDDDDRSTAGANVEIETIKPGEASLVAPFSCLRPSIDCVDAVLRSGVATAACALATQKTIALHALMACYHLASLYRDGFRYGKNMWTVELYMYILVDQARYGAACTARPRLPPAPASLRPPISLFYPESLLSTVAQAVIHLVTMAIGVDYARHLEKTVSQPRTATSTRIQLRDQNYPGKLGKFLGALTEGVGANEEGEVGLFRRRKFRPNYETGIVFMLSILQSGVSCLVNHQGKPFYRSILETKDVCVASGLTLLFVVACITETFPAMIRFLEIRRLPGTNSRLTFLSIVVANVAACLCCRILSDISLKINDSDEELSTAKRSSRRKRTAADLEEELLKEEENYNLRTMMKFLGGTALLVLESLGRKAGANS